MDTAPRKSICPVTTAEMTAVQWLEANIRIEFGDGVQRAFGVVQARVSRDRPDRPTNQIDRQGLASPPPPFSWLS